MEKLCHWCKKLITRQDTFVLSTQRLPNGERFQWRYHAKPCYKAWVEFRDLHAFQPLDPSTHDHEA